MNYEEEEVNRKNSNDKLKEYLLIMENEFENKIKVN